MESTEPELRLTKAFAITAVAAWVATAVSAQADRVGASLAIVMCFVCVAALTHLPNRRPWLLILGGLAMLLIGIGAGVVMTGAGSAAGVFQALAGFNVLAAGIAARV